MPFKSRFLINLLPENRDSDRDTEDGSIIQFVFEYGAIPIYYIKCSSDDCIREYNSNKLAYVKNMDEDISINYYNSTISTALLYDLISKHTFKPCAYISSSALGLIFPSVNRSFLLYFRERE